MNRPVTNLLLLVASRPPEVTAMDSLLQRAGLFGEEDKRYLSCFTNRQALALRMQARRLLLHGLQEMGLMHKPVHLHKTKEGRPYLSPCLAMPHLLPDVSLSFSYADRALCLLGTREGNSDEKAEELFIGSDWEEKRTHHLPPASFLGCTGTCMDVPKEGGPDEAARIPSSRILSLWCRTEAVLKAAGCGLRIHPHAIEWTKASQQSSEQSSGFTGLALVPGPKGKELYTWQDVQLDSKHLCAVAVKGESQDLDLQIRFVEEDWPSLCLAHAPE